MTDGRRLRALVVDDEPIARDAVRTLLTEHPEVECVGEADGVDAALRAVHRLRPDLLFLDVQMPGRDGFALIEALGADVPRGVVFVTAFDEHAVRAFDVHALDYLVKPFGRPRFAAALRRAVSRLRAEDALSLRRTLASLSRSQGQAEAPGELFSAPGTSASRPERFAVRRGERLLLIAAADVDWVEADGDYVRLHAGAEAHFVASRLADFEALLDPRRFVRIHRSLLVQLDRVRELERDPEGGGAAILRDGVRLRVARHRWEDLQRALGLA